MIFITSISADPGISGLTPDLTIYGAEEYTAGYWRILQAIHAGETLQVHVHNRKVAGWLKIMALRYGRERIQFNTRTVRSFLEERIGLPIPEEFTEQEMNDSGLLDLNIPASGQSSFEDYILEVFFGSFLNKSDTVARVTEIIAAYEPEQWQAALKRPLIKKILQKRFRRLREGMQGRSAELLLLKWLEQSPETYIRNLSALKSLRAYPDDLGVRIFEQVYREISLLNLDLRRVPIIIRENEKTLAEIRLHIRQIVSSNDPASAFDKLLEQTSGNLEEEMRAVVDLLCSGKMEITRPQVERVLRKFGQLQSQPHIAQELNDLDLLISVPVPSAPQEDWDVDHWLHWAVQEYLPYRFWLENTAQLNDEIGEVAGKYADWLYVHYGELLYNSNSMAWKAVLNLKEKMKIHTGPVLVVMMDNFNLKYYPILKKQLRQQGFYEQDVQYCISMLPTFTEVSKKCIITGHFEPFDGFYSETVQSTWQSKLGKKVCYLANIVELRRVAERTHDIYFLNYLPVDMVLHQPDNHTGITHRQSVQFYMVTLAQDIRAFAYRLGAERDLMVVFMSDHGSTRIPSQTVNVLDNVFYKKHAVDEHHRYLVITDGEAVKLSKQVEYDCYLFKRTQYPLPQNYLVARRLYRFLPTKDSLYIHGGLTPEETIVPLAIYQPFIVTPRPLLVTITEPNKIITGTRLDLVMEITNHNSYPVEHLTLEILSANLEAGPVEIEEIQKLQRCTVHIKARCPASADETEDKLQMRLTFKFNEQEHEQVVETPVKYGALMKTRFSLDDL